MNDDESLRRFNQATYDDLLGIEGIGQKLAQAILTFRDGQNQGCLADWESLEQVYGIDEQRINVIRVKFEKQFVAEVPKTSNPPSQSEPPQSKPPKPESVGAMRWEITALSQENRPARPRWFLWVISLGIPIAIFYGFFLYGLTDELGFEEQMLALESTVGPLTRNLDSARATIVHLERETPVERTLEVTKQVTVVVEVTPQVAAESTASSLQFTASEVSVNDACSEVEPPCIYLIRQGDERLQIAGQSPFADACRWPEILDLNRTVEGAYPTLSTGAPLFTPKDVERGIYPPMISEGGEWRLVQKCTDTTGLPCRYTVEDGMYGNRYSEIARMFYKDPTLANVIIQANRESDCSTNPIALYPGMQIVIPVPVRSNR
jgi:hypothetical protein